MAQKRPLSQLFDRDLSQRFRSKADFYCYLTENRKYFSYKMTHIIV